MLRILLNPALAEAKPDRASAGGSDHGRPRRRALWAFAALVLGYLLARATHAPEAWPFLLAGALVALAAMALRAARPAVTLRLLFCATLLLSAGWYALRIHQPQRHALRLQPEPTLAAAPLPVSLRAVILEPPPPEPDTPPRAALLPFFRIERATTFTVGLISAGPDHQPASGRLRVRVPLQPDRPLPLTDADDRALRAGDLVELQGLFRPVRPPMNPGEPDRAARAAQDRLLGTLTVPTPELITRLPIEEAPPLDRALAPFRRALAALRHHANAALAQALADPEAHADPPPRTSAANAPFASSEPTPADINPDSVHRAQARALLAAMLLGARDEHLPQITDAFTRLGLTHLVAISGFNMVLLAGLVLMAIRLTGDHGTLEPLVACAVIALYLLILPLEAPALRGGLMVIAFIIADAAGRRYDRLTILAWIALALAILQPLDVFSPGYQLTFGIVAALLTLSPRVRDRLFGPDLRGVQRPALPVGRAPAARAERAGIRARMALASLRDNGKLAVAAAITAWAVATPVVAYHTGLVSTLAPITTLIVGPLCSVFIAVGYVALLFGAFIPALAAPIGLLLDSLGGALVLLVHTLDAVPGATFRLPPISAPLAVVSVALACWWLTRAGASSRPTLAATLLVAIWFAVETLPARSLPDNVRLRIDALAVGDGACLLLRSADRGVLWDCGSLNPALGSRAIPDALRALGVTRLDAVFITHTNLDHFAALPDLARSVPVGRVITTDAFINAVNAGADPTAPGEQRAAAALRRALAALDPPVPFETVVAGDQRQLGHARLHVLWPDPRAIDGLDPQPRRIDPNDLSLVVRLDVPTAQPVSRSVLLTGDVARLAIPLLLDRDADPADHDASRLRADVLEIPHHGSFIEPSVELLRRVNPSVVLQSTGPNRARDPRWPDAAPAFFPPPDQPATGRSNPGRTAPGRAWLTTARNGWSAVTIDRYGSVNVQSIR